MAFATGFISEIIFRNNAAAFLATAPPETNTTSRSASDTDSIRGHISLTASGPHLTLVAEGSVRDFCRVVHLS